MTHPVTLEALAKARQQDLWREAEAYRMACQARIARPASPGLVKHIVDGVRNLLSGFGKRGHLPTRAEQPYSLSSTQCESGPV